MSEKNLAQEKLRELLDQTRKKEMDCDEFFERAAAVAEGTVDDESVLELFKHHRELCGECEEHFQILLRALGKI